MTMRLAVLAGLLALAASIIVLPSGRALAHEHRAVGNYELEVGFINEPALAYELNGLFLSVAFFENGVPEEGEHSEGAEEEGVPVEGLEETLEAEVVVGGGAETMPLTLEGRFGQPGAYQAHFIPTLVGDYTFRIFGAIDGEAIDEMFDSGPETFSSVDDVSELQFPDKLPNNAELQASIDELAAKIDALDSGGDSDTALILAIVGVVVGAVGIGVGGLALASRRGG